MNLMGSLDREKATANHKVIMITLTYGRSYPSPLEGKNHLRSFIKRITRINPKFAGIWKMEFQERGAVHFHLLCFNQPFLPGQLVNQLWGEVINWNRSLEICEYPRCEVKLVRSWRGVMSYASKYIGKVDNRPVPPVSLSVCHNGPNENEEEKNKKNENEKNKTNQGDLGRFWGIFGRKWLPLGVCHRVPCAFGDGRWFHQFKRSMRRFWKGMNKFYGCGGTVWVASINPWLEWACRLAYSGVPPGIVVSVEG